jgi:transposase InsO family protein
MPFNSKTVMEHKQEFAMLAAQSGANFSLLCRRFNISRKTGYKWIDRYLKLGVKGLGDQSKCPRNIPIRTQKSVEQRIIALRSENPEWGAKKLHKLLENERAAGLFADAVPAHSTITRILNRHGMISDQKSAQAKPWQRFEYEYPNELWQMDFKGHFTLLNSKYCYPLTITDDHSRFNIGLFACDNQRYETVRELLCRVFTTYGIPNKILADNGSPWGTTGQMAADGERVFSTLEKWLISHQIKLIHGRAYHPQTQGKEERFHRTLKTELLNYEQFKDLVHCQHKFDQWRDKYNCYRPHEALSLEVPAQRYKPSLRTFENVIIKPEYDSSSMVRIVDIRGNISYQGKVFKIGKAFIGDSIALKQTESDGVLEAYFYQQLIRYLSLH